MTAIPAPVLAGAALLPAGWQARVVTESLDLSDPERDILGQLCPDSALAARGRALSLGYITFGTLPCQRSFAYAQALSGLDDTKRHGWTVEHGFWSEDPRQREKFEQGWRALVAEYRGAGQ